jgi:hypothetical protein
MPETFREGDRVEWVGPSAGPSPMGPQTGEQGWLEMIDPQDDVVVWDHCGTQAGDFSRLPESLIRRVGDRNEPDPRRRLPGDPFATGE